MLLDQVTFLAVDIVLVAHFARRGMRGSAGYHDGVVPRRLVVEAVRALPRLDGPVQHRVVEEAFLGDLDGAKELGDGWRLATRPLALLASGRFWRLHGEVRDAHPHLFLLKMHPGSYSLAQRAVAEEVNLLVYVFLARPVRVLLLLPVASGSMTDSRLGRFVDLVVAAIYSIVFRDLLPALLDPHLPLFGGRG